MIAPSMAVSVAVVTLDRIRTGTAVRKRDQLCKYIPLFCFALLGQLNEQAPEVVSAS